MGLGVSGEKRIASGLCLHCLLVLSGAYQNRMEYSAQSKAGGAARADAL